jgi:starch phosphorylase
MTSMPKRILRSVTVLPKLPARLQTLNKLAHNLWYSWNYEAVALFRRIDVHLWDNVDHSPVKMLGAVSPDRVQELLDDEGFLAQMDRVEQSFQSYLNAPTWFQETFAQEHPELAEKLVIAYFSAEFGIHESVPVYSGGLGVLSGDHLKSASDLGLPLTGVGLMYREGYFRQYLTGDGWQQERYPENDFFHLPLTLEVGSNGDPILVDIPFPNRKVLARIWTLRVGRVPLHLLDTNIPQNASEDRGITARLYGGDHDMRVRQEMVLGIGGVRALRALGKTPTVCHMNEGHSAFCGLERIRDLMATTGCDFDTAREAVNAGTVFTTHTPVPAGNDAFAAHLMDQYFHQFFPQLGLDRQRFLALGRQNGNDNNELFGMTVLALRLSNIANGVSKLHGSVSRKMWRNIWSDLPESEVPITSITNGIHINSWISHDMSSLYERYLGRKSTGRPDEQDLWTRVESIPDTELWRTHERRRERLVAFTRARLKKQLKARNALPTEIAMADEVLDPEALTIGFARRFATYKRGTLIFRTLERLLTLLNDKDRPIQIIFSGKAHPQDQKGKELIADILKFARRTEFRHRMVFLEDYDMNIARYLVQGVDIWLNNPRRPLEASGTSGMKAAVNGGLNLSILDGWWVEGYNGENGWAIGAGEEYSDLEYQDNVESRALYDLLEQEIIPLFYQRGGDGVPRGWVRRMKRCIASLAPVFNTGRMVAEYANVCYFPSAVRFAKLNDAKLTGANQLAHWRKNVATHWPQIRISNVNVTGGEGLHVGGTLHVEAFVQLGKLTPADVQVQLYHGLLDNMGEIHQPRTCPMQVSVGQDGYIYKGTIECDRSGQIGYALRILPRHADLASPFEPGLVCWG